MFIRSLVGLDREAATEAFNRYLSDTTFSAAELRFIQMIVEQLTANGIMEAARPYESPFTDVAPRGPDMIFTDEQVDGIVAILDDVRHHALPDVTAA
jgi:type I restriction enzyme R subunit